MKVREVITTKGWVDGSGYSYSTVISNKIIEVSEEALHGQADWSWWEETELRENEDIQIVMEWFAADDEDEESPLAEWETWARELQEA